MIKVFGKVFVLLLAVLCMGVMKFNETNNYISIADDTSLTLPDGDWVVGILVKVDDNTGTLFQYLVSNNNFGVNNSINIYLAEATQEAEPNSWVVRTVDGDGTTGIIEGLATFGADSKWRWWFVQRNTTDNEIQLWYCTVPTGSWETAVKDASAADTNFNAVNGGLWNIGRRVDGNVDRYYGEYVGEVFKANMALTQAQMELICNARLRYMPMQITGGTIKMYLLLDETPDGTSANFTHYDRTGNGNNGTGVSSPTGYADDVLSYP